MGIRTRPLIAVVSRVPLFAEAMVGAFAGLADVHAISADDSEAQGLVRAFRPDAVIAEGEAAKFVDREVPCLRVDLDPQAIHIREADTWRVIDVDLSPEAIRNVLIARLYGGEIG